MTPEEAFGATLREQRDEAQISQGALALEIGLDRTYISLLERGLRQPSLKTIISLADGLSISPSTLVEETLKKMGR